MNGFSISFRFRKLLKKNAEFVFMTSPVKVPCKVGEEEEGGAGWWFSQPNNSFKAQDVSECVKGYQV